MRSLEALGCLLWLANVPDARGAGHDLDEIQVSSWFGELLHVNLS